MKEIIIVSITAFLSLGSFIIVYLQSKEIGPIFTNAYIYATKTEREKLDKKYEYNLAKNIFIGIGILFLLQTLDVITHWTWTFYASISICVILVIYAIFKLVKNGYK